MVDVDKTLEILIKEYADMFKMLRRAEYEPPNVLHGTLRSTGFVFSSDGTAPSGDSPINHFTAIEAVPAINQMSYVLFACMAQEGRLEGVRPLSLEELNPRKYNQQVAKKMAMDFKRPFKSTDEFHARTSIVNYRVARTPTGLYVVTQHEFDFNDGCAYAKCTAATTLQGEDLVQN